MVACALHSFPDGLILVKSALVRGYNSRKFSGSKSSVTGLGRSERVSAVGNLYRRPLLGFNLRHGSPKSHCRLAG
jgi:hypothetical protein